MAKARIPTKAPAKATEALPQLESLRPALAELERAAYWLADRFCSQITHKVVVTIQTKGKKANCLGWFSEAQWSTREGEDVHEINVTAESLQGEVIDIFHTMAHELCHLENNFADIKDVAKGGRHNRKFQETAELFQLVVEDPVDGRGYTTSGLTEDFEKEVREDFKPDVGAFNLFRQVKLKEKTVNKTKAYICSCEDSATLRTAKDFQATCDVCGEPFVLKA